MSRVDLDFISPFTIAQIRTGELGACSDSTLHCHLNHLDGRLKIVLFFHLFLCVNFKLIIKKFCLSIFSSISISFRSATAAPVSASHFLVSSRQLANSLPRFRLLFFSHFFCFTLFCCPIVFFCFCLAYYRALRNNARASRVRKYTQNGVRILPPPLCTNYHIISYLCIISGVFLRPKTPRGA